MLILLLNFVVIAYFGIAAAIGIFCLFTSIPEQAKRYFKMRMGLGFILKNVVWYQLSGALMWLPLLAEELQLQLQIGFRKARKAKAAASAKSAG